MPAPFPRGSFAVELPVFTGPFRLLAELIIEQKVDVCDVAVATVTDGYLAYAKEPDAWNLEEATWFLAICAVLLELKVGRLMPRHTEQNEDDLLGASPDLAYARCMELAAFRKVAVELARRLEDEAGFFTRDVGPGPEFSHLYPDPMTKVDAEAGPTGRATAPAAAHARPHARDADPLHDGRGDDGRRERIEDFGGPASFRDLVADCDERIQVVVRFLALLELYRDGRVELHQGETFGEIRRGVAGMTMPKTEAGGERHGHAGARGAVFVSDEPLTPSVSRSRSSRPADRRGALRPARGGARGPGCGRGAPQRRRRWRLFTHPDTAPEVERFVLSSRQARLTKAALETLAIVAYEQPVTRHQVRRFGV